MTVDVRVADAAAFRPWLRQAAQVYGAAMRRAPELVVQRHEIMQSHLGRDGFVAVVAVELDRGGDGADIERLVGFGYGYQGRRGDWWHDVVAARLGRHRANEWLDGAFELAELHVDPAYQGIGIGRRVIELLLAQTPDRTVVLSTHDRESAARRLYASLGFVDLLRAFVFPGSTEVYAVMGKRP